MKMLSIIFCFGIIFCGHVYGEDEKVQIVYSGNFFAGGTPESMKSEFPNLGSDSERCRELVNEKIRRYKLPFDLILFYGENKKKGYDEVWNPLSFTILITQETHVKEAYYDIKTLGDEDLVINVFYVGLAAIFFTPVENKDIIEYSIPIIKSSKERMSSIRKR